MGGEHVDSEHVDGDDVGLRVKRALHLAATMLAAAAVCVPALRALPLLLRADASGATPLAWVTLAPAFASALALALVPLFLVLPGRGTAFLTYAAIAALPPVIGRASGDAAPLAAQAAFAVPALALGALLAAWGVAARQARRAAALALYA